MISCRSHCLNFLFEEWAASIVTLQKCGVTFDLKFSILANFRPALRTWPELRKFWPEL
jgi:hypothetical protein